jgi:NTE family protein
MPTSGEEQKVLRDLWDFDEENFLIDTLWNRFKNSDKKKPTIALALGGGGARGLSHIGVFTVLIREQIPIDFVAGVSVGSIVGAFYCAGLPLEKIEKMSENMSWNKIAKLNIFSIYEMLFNNKMLSNKKLEEFISENTNNITFDELKVPLVCVTTDLYTGEKVLIKEGNVGAATRASAAIPGIFRPVEYRQRYLMDGGIVENLPVDTARLFGADIIIAVSVAADIEKNKVDNTFEILTQAIYIQGQKIDSENLKNTDIVIRPQVGDISIVSFGEHKKAIKQGVIAAKNAIKNIKVVIINKMTENSFFE